MRAAVIAMLLTACAPHQFTRACAFGAETDATADYCCKQNFGQNFKAEEPRLGAGCADPKATAFSKG